MARTRARDARPQRRPTRTGAFSLSGVALVGVLGWVALTDRDVRTTGLHLTSGAAWLASPARGLVTLIDGPSEGVIASIDLNTAGQVGVAQDGTSAFVTDDATGTVYRLDGATVEVAKAVRFGAAGSQLEVLTGTESAYVVDATARVATLVDDRELTVQSTVPLAARPGPNQTVVDAANRLWVVDADGSGLLRSDPDGGQQRTPISGSSVLAIAGGNAVAIDRAVPNPAVTALKPDGSAAEWPCRLPVRPGERAELLGDPDGDAVIAAIEQSGTLAVVDDSADCVSPVQLADPGSSFGALAMSDQFVFVPNHSTGSTLVVDLATRVRRRGHPAHRRRTRPGADRQGRRRVLQRPRLGEGRCAPPRCKWAMGGRHAAAEVRPGHRRSERCLDRRGAEFADTAAAGRPADRSGTGADRAG